MSLVDSVANDKMVPPPALAGFLNCFNIAPNHYWNS